MPRAVSTSAGFNSMPNGNFIPVVWSKKLLYTFYASTCIDKILNHDWEGEIKDKGAKVEIRQRPTVSVSDYTIGGSIAYQDLDDEKITLLIDKAKYWAFSGDEIDIKQADINFMDEASTDAAEQMKITVEQDVFDTIYAQTSAANQMSSTPLDKTNVLDWIVDAGVLLDEANVPESRRWLVIPPWIAGRLLKSDLKDASMTGDGQSVLRNGRLGMIDRFTIYRSNNVNNDATTWNCIAGVPEFCCFASQFVKTDLNLVLENTFGRAHRGLKVYGYKVTKSDAGVLMPATKG